METEDGSNGNVLVVDDDPAVGKVLSAQLAQAGITCRHVLDASAALALLRERPVDVVITDLRMPGASGLELLAEIGVRWPDIPTRFVLCRDDRSRTRMRMRQFRL